MNIVSHEEITVRSEGIALDLIIWQRFKRPMNGLLEAALDLPQNQHLADYPAIIPVGTVILLPIPQERETERVTIRSLWD